MQPLWSTPNQTGWPGRSVALMIVLAVAIRLPFLTTPLSPDEGGFLMVADQWANGRSVYGDYFVDRPPGLLFLYGLASSNESSVALRILGLGAVATLVLLAGLLGGSRAAAAAAVFVSTPRFDALKVDGELLAVPIVVAGMYALCCAERAHEQHLLGRRCAYWAVAGIFGGAAVMVKQNMLEVAIAAVVLIAGSFFGSSSASSRGQWLGAGCRMGAFALGWATTSTLALILAEARGTTTPAVWDAAVLFRAQAAAVIAESASASNDARAHELVVALSWSGLPLVVLVCIVGFRSPRPGPGPDLRWAAIAVLVWEGVGVAMGGSYWLHYLILFVPGVVLAIAAAHPVPGRDLMLSLAAASTCWALVDYSHVASHRGPDQQVAAYLRANSAHSDTAVVAFGHPNILRDANIASPYEHLWSLPARVRDPKLRELRAVLTGPAAPEWVVVHGDSLSTWGIDATEAQPALEAGYHQVNKFGAWAIHRRNE